MTHAFDVSMKRQSDVGHIEIYDSIGSGEQETTAKSFAEKLKALGDVKKIKLSINSLGGSLFHGVSIYNQLREHGAEIEVQVNGFALSMASLIMLAGDKRTIASNGFVMVHKPHGRVDGGADEYRAAADLYDKLTASMVSTYAERTGQSIESVTAMMSTDTWLSADEAIAKGFATHKGKEVKLAASFDPEQFQNMPTDVKALLASAGGDSSGKGEKPMTQQEAQGPVPATIAQIEAECVGAGSDFVLTQVKASATLENAKSAWMKLLVEDLKAQKAELDKLTKEMQLKSLAPAIAAVSAELKKKGAPVIESGVGETVSMSASDEWNQLLEKIAANGKVNLQQAAMKANRERPELREAMLAERNAR